ncbi:hypothetical protein ABH20_18550 [Geobacillus sp. T6]|nr:hypothetical protein ABH20_18550 [Geobacillus sp. T6]
MPAYCTVSGNDGFMEDVLLFFLLIIIIIIIIIIHDFLFKFHGFGRNSAVVRRGKTAFSERGIRFLH